MLFTVGLAVIFFLVIVSIFAYQKLYNPGRLCNICYRVVPDLSPTCPFCESELKWDD